MAGPEFEGQEERREANRPRDDWPAIVEAVKTPLGFFALVVLAVEGILAVGVGLTSGPNQTYLVLGMIGLVASLILLVTGMAVWRPESLYGKTPEIVVSIAKAPAGSGSPDTQDGGVAEVVENPKFLIAGSEAAPWDRFLEEDRGIITAAFPGSTVSVEPAETAAGFSQALLTLGAHAQVWQLSAQVEGSGSIQIGSDSLPPRGLGEVVRQSRPKLVVLAACASASVAAEIAPSAATGTLDSDAWKRWSTIFYTLLATGVPLSRAFAITQAVDGLPVAMILRRDMIFAGRDQRSLRAGK
ncbi:hypothetical protein ACWT_5840 [Actinoplanes sp. SE50]|uniref:hypothetical protein n=1 Tax=unclassified Actinoplanes TaxID=2626549 RepID=UPI00023EBDBC|nr:MULTISPECIES: hypothetical protein [unclassified Actinoplanes]AEV86858.1 hypothetical protein ACPL_5971 [Actinoplanes sp. SE50/110]ATO85255.1 hypothetical protein ACWT_5840 [Actinoplanes sp. SE50]SLM02665.1 hypothetical protein ACSP50_5947 [Actinoplanes sp. SE50/110]